MELLERLWREAPEPGYAAATARGRQTPVTSKVLMGALMVVLGIGFAPAVQVLREPDARAAESRPLVERIAVQRASGDDLAGQVATLRAEVDELQQQEAQLTGELGAAEERTRREAALGADITALVGPGLRIMLDDAELPEGETELSDASRVASQDLQVVVNALWEAGAEGVSVNGQRISSLTALRFAGQALVVNFRPIAPPYVIEAVGDQVMADRFVSGPGGKYLTALRDSVGLRFGHEMVGELSLRPASLVTVRHARVHQDAAPTVAVSTTTQKEG